MTEPDGPSVSGEIPLNLQKNVIQPHAHETGLTPEASAIRPSVEFF